MKKEITINIDHCIECPCCSESGPDGDTCFHDNNPNGDDCTKIPDVYVIPNWCPLKDVMPSNKDNQNGDQEIARILEKHYFQIMEELKAHLKVDDIKTVADIELKYRDTKSNNFEFS